MKTPLTDPIVDIVSFKSGTGGATAAKRAPTRPEAQVVNGTVLIIEDDEDVSRLISLRLRSDGLRVVTTQDGEEGVRIALARRPDLIFLDLMLPSIDGFAILRMLCTLPSMRRIPVVVLTALAGDTAEKAAREWLNVMHFVRKPVDMQEMSKIVADILRLPVLD